MAYKGKLQSSLSQKIDQEAMKKLVRLIAEQHSFTEISRLMPAQFPTKGSFAGKQWTHAKELQTLVTAYLVAHGPVEKKGHSKPFRRNMVQKKKVLQRVPTIRPVEKKKTVRETLIAESLLEWHSRRRLNPSPFVHAAMAVNKTRVKSSDAILNAEMVQQIIASAKGAGQLVIAHLGTDGVLAASLDASVRRF